MILQDFYTSEPMKYWTPPKAKNIENDILQNPAKYSDYIAMQKKDGEWSRVIIDEDNNVTIQSRSISKVTGTYTDRTDKVPHLVEAFKKLNCPNSVILGEIFFDDLSTTSKDVGSIMRCLAPKAIQRQKDNPLHFYAFDLLMYVGEDYTSEYFLHRIATLKTFFENCNPYIHVAETYPIDDKFEALYTDYMRAGGEGFLLMRQDALYAPGTRTAWRSIKLKKHLDSLELPVVSTLEPNKEYKGTEAENWQYIIDGELVTKPYYYGWVNGVVVSHNDTLVSVASGMTDQLREQLATEEWQNAIKNGEVKAVVSAMETTEDGSLRHPYLEKIIKI